jgi:hypothetical protein
MTVWDIAVIHPVCPNISHRVLVSGAELAPTERLFPDSGVRFRRVLSDARRVVTREITPETGA